MKFLFSDGTDICVYEDGKVTKRGSKFIEKFKTASINVERAKSWKHSGEGARFRGDVHPDAEDLTFNENINGVYPDKDGQAVYSFSVNNTSGIYKLNPYDEKGEETHVINSIEYEFAGGCLDTRANILATSVRRNSFNSDIALFDLNSGDWRTLTEGDTLDEDPFICPEDGNIIYFISRGVGRDMNGAFAGYSPAGICKLNISALDIEEVAVSNKYSYIKPVEYGGKLYAIKIPAKEKKPNPIIEILLIPFRIIQAIANFVNVFVRAFTGKSLASGGSNPAKGREYDSRKEYIKGNLINADKEMKRNAKKNKSDYGFIPLTWKLVEVESDKIIKSGIADFDILPDGTIIATNGKRIFSIRDEKSTKLCDAECCLCVAGEHSSEKKSDLFEF
ncbi:MAG: hypothetical protein K2L12_02820 [Clostridia bacterium]|nr:hypothetical protein [Clostridia bacterium]